MKFILPLGLVIAAASSTQALFLAIQSMSYATDSNGGGQFPSPYCQVGSGDTLGDAQDMAGSEGTDAYSLYAGGDCTIFNDQSGNQPGDEYWSVNGYVNTIQNGRKYDCYIDSAGVESGNCDAGDGVPSPYKAKRSRVFAKEYVA